MVLYGFYSTAISVILQQNEVPHSVAHDQDSAGHACGYKTGIKVLCMWHSMHACGTPCMHAYTPCNYMFRRHVAISGEFLLTVKISYKINTVWRWWRAASMRIRSVIQI